MIMECGVHMLSRAHEASEAKHKRRSHLLMNEIQASKGGKNAYDNEEANPSSTTASMLLTPSLLVIGRWNVIGRRHASEEHARTNQ